MEHTTIAPRRALRRASALFLAATVSVVAFAGAAAASEYPPNPGVRFDATCTPEDVPVGGSITCTVPAGDARQSTMGSFEIFDNVEDWNSLAYIDLNIEDGVEAEDGSLVFTLTIPDDIAPGSGWFFQFGGRLIVDQCYAVDFEGNGLAGPGEVSWFDDESGFLIDDDEFSFDDAISVCDAENRAVASGTIVAAADGGEGGGESGTGTGVTAPSAQAGTGTLPRTGAGAGALALVGLLTAALGAGTLQAPRLASWLRRR